MLDWLKIVFGVVFALLVCAGAAAALEIAVAYREALRSPAGQALPRKLDTQGPVTVLVLGDSLAYGYGASVREKSFVYLLGERLALARARSKILNNSFPGTTTADLFAQLKRAPASGIDIVFVVAGANDIRKLTTPLAFARSQRQLLERIHAKYPRAPVLMTNVPDVSGSYFAVPSMHRRTQGFAPLRAPLRYLIDLDDELQNSLAHEYGAKLLDLHRLSQNKLAHDPRFVSADGLHPSDAGHARIAAYIWPAFAELLSQGIICTSRAPQS